MTTKITKKMLPLKVERRDSVRQWLTDNGLPPELLWDGEAHASCPNHIPGHWVFMSYGDYQGADWQTRLYISHRCSRCGIMVQHNQVCAEAGKNRPPITRLVTVP